MPPPDGTPLQHVRTTLQRAGISVADERLETLVRATEAARGAGEAIARAVEGDRPPSLFRAPDPRNDA